MFVYLYEVHWFVCWIGANWLLSFVCVCWLLVCCYVYFDAWFGLGLFVWIVYYRFVVCACGFITLLFCDLDCIIVCLLGRVWFVYLIFVFMFTLECCVRVTMLASSVMRFGVANWMFGCFKYLLICLGWFCLWFCWLGICMLMLKYFELN